MIVLLRMYLDAELHSGMTGSAKLCAYALILAGLVRLYTNDGRVTGRAVDLPGKPGNPEAVDHVAARDMHIHKAASRHVHHVGGCPRPSRMVVAERPVPLLPCRLNP